MFEFYDPCESCSQPLDSPACKECKYYDPCSDCPYELHSAACWGNEDCPFQQ